MNVSAPFIRRPVATSLIAIAIMLSGIAAYFELPVAPLPRVDFPTIQVSGGLPGASPETMASSVATPLERRFGRIAGVTEITSTSSLGATSIALQFALDRDVDAAARDVQAAISAAGGELPPNLPTRPTYRKVNPADSPILIISLTSDAIPLSTVYQQANSILAEKISQVPGVGQVFVGGGQQPAVRVQVDPAALAGLGLTTADVRTVLAQATIDQPKGSFSGALQTTSIAANDQLYGAAAYKPIVVTYKNGAPVRLSDIANVIDDVENNRVAAWADGKRAVLLIIRRQPGANILDVIDRVKAVLPQLATSISPAIHTEVLIDRSQSIRASVHDVEISLLISVVLVIIVVFAFLRSVRATSIPSVAVPLSLAGTFAIMYLFGYSLDNLSLMALTISTGFVVDDAIVVTENVSRLIEGGEDPMRAAFDGAKQIGFTIVSITVSLIAVFIPILLMGGIIGRLFREFAVTLAIAVAVSAFVSLTLTPMMCSRLLRHEPVEQRGKLYRGSEHVFNWLLRGYERMLDVVLHHPIIMIVVWIGTFIAMVGCFLVVPLGLFPQQDAGQIAGFTEGPQDVSFAAMRDAQMQLNGIISQEKDIAHYVSFMGSGGGGTGNTGNIFGELKPRNERKSSADEIVARLRPKTAKISSARLFLQSVQDVRIGGRATRTQYQFTLQDANLDELKEWAPKVLDKLKTLPELKDVASDQQTAGLELALDIDRDTAARLGIQPQQVDDALYDAFGQRQVATLFTQRDQFRVVIEIKPELQKSADALDQIYVPSPTGAVPLDTITKVHQASTSLSISHQGQFPSVTLSFNLAPGAALGPAVDAINQAEGAIGMPASIYPSFSGTAKAFQDSLSGELALVIGALVAVYIVLGMLYESYVHPITILSTLPSAGLGAMLALIITHTEFSIIALIGIILLIGIVKKNAIMMIDFAIETQRADHSKPFDAIRKACLMRFRPIMMTTMCALLGAVPLAIGTGTGSEMRRPLGITIVGGLIISQMLTLFTTPVIYLVLDSLFPTRAPERETTSLTPSMPLPPHEAE